MAFLTECRSEIKPHEFGKKRQKDLGPKRLNYGDHVNINACK